MGNQRTTAIPVHGQRWRFERPWLTFFGGWLLAHLIGGAVAGVVELRLQFLGTLVLAGSAVAVVEWFFLRSTLPRAGRWALMLALGWPLAHLLYTLVPGRFSEVITWLVAHGFFWPVFWLNCFRLAFVLFIIGALQWVITRPLPVVGRWWLGVSLVAGAGQGALNATLCMAYCDLITARFGTVILGMFLGSSGWLGYALITGLILTLRQQHLINTNQSAFIIQPP